MKGREHMNKGIIAFGVLAAAGLTGAVTQAEIQAADADALVTPAPAGVTEEVSQDTAITNLRQMQPLQI